MDYTMLSTGSEKSISSVRFPDASGTVREFSLALPVILHAGKYSVYAICRWCVIRMGLKAIEKLLLNMFLDDAENGINTGYSYSSLAKIMGKCRHSVEAAISALRKHGFIITARVGRNNATISISVDPIVRWAKVCVSGESDKVGYSGSEIPNRSCSGSQASSGTCSSAGQLYSSDVSVGSQECPHMAAPYEGEFDASIERADTLEAAGRASSGEDDDDEISLGSDTADTDMGHGVRMNPNI